MGILEPTEREKAGIIPRALETIFATIDNAEPSLQYQVHMSFVQIYLEDVQDLLVSAALPKLAVRQSRRGEFFADGLGEFQVSTFQEAVCTIGKIFCEKNDRILVANVGRNWNEKPDSRCHTTEHDVLSFSYNVKHSSD